MKSWLQSCFNFAATVTIMVSLAHYLNDEVERTIGPIHCATDRIAVYSDVDDTLQCSHEHNGAGVDTQLPSKTIYPGAVAFELALSRGVNNEPALPVVLLSARPKVLKWLLGIGADHPIARSFRKHDARFARRYITTLRESRSNSESVPVEPAVAYETKSDVASSNKTTINATEQASEAPSAANFFDAMFIEEAKGNESTSSNGGPFAGRSDKESRRRYQEAVHEDGASVDTVNGNDNDQELYDFLLSVSEGDTLEESIATRSEPQSRSVKPESERNSGNVVDPNLPGYMLEDVVSAGNAKNGNVSNENVDVYASELGATCEWIPIPFASRKNMKMIKSNTNSPVVRNDIAASKSLTGDGIAASDGDVNLADTKPHCLERCEKGSQATSRSFPGDDLADFRRAFRSQNHDGRWKIDQGFPQDPYGACPWVDAHTGLPGAEAVGTLAVLEWPPTVVPPASFFNQDWVDASQRLVAWAEWQLASGGFRSSGYRDKYSRGRSYGGGAGEHGDDNDGPIDGDSALFRYLPLQPLAPLTMTLNLGGSNDNHGLSTGIEALEPLVRLWAHAQGFPESARGLLGLSASSSGSNEEGMNDVVFIDDDLGSDSEHSNQYDDSDNSKGMVGIDVERNLYGNLHDFFHDTRARYVAIGRTKLANIIASEGAHDDNKNETPNSGHAGDATTTTMNIAVPEDEPVSPPVDDTVGTACGKGCNTYSDNDSSSNSNSSSTTKRMKYRNRANALKQKQCLAFVGDSGQGDELVARGLLGYPGSYDDPMPSRALLNRVAAAFIHDIDAPRNDPFTDRFMPSGVDHGRESSRAWPRGANLARYHRFTSYAGAALAAFTNCRISLEGLEDVVIAVEESTEYRACAAMSAATSQTHAASSYGTTTAPSAAPTTSSSPCGKGSGDQCCRRLLHGVKEARDAVLGYERGADHFNGVYSGPRTGASSKHAGSNQSHHNTTSNSGSNSNTTGSSNSSTSRKLNHHEPLSPPSSPSRSGLLFEIPWRRVLARHSTRAKCSSLRTWGQVAAAVTDITEAALVSASLAALDWVPTASHATTNDEDPATTTRRNAETTPVEPAETPTAATSTAAPATSVETAPVETMTETAAKSNVASKFFGDATVPNEASSIPASSSSKPSISAGSSSDAVRNALTLARLRLCCAGSAAGQMLLTAAIPGGTREYIRGLAEQYLGRDDEYLM